MALVLVVEDELEMLRLIGRILTDAGYEVAEAQNGHEALAQVTTRLPDVVITDLFMPDKEGIETIRALRGDYPNLPIIAMTGGGLHRNLELLSLAEKFGANARLAKPFRRSELLEAIEKLL